MRHNSHKRRLLAHAKYKLSPKKYTKKILLLPVMVKKHPVQTIGLATLGLGLMSGILWYNIKR